MKGLAAIISISLFVSSIATVNGGTANCHPARKCPPPTPGPTAVVTPRPTLAPTVRPTTGPAPTTSPYTFDDEFDSLRSVWGTHWSTFGDTAAWTRTNTSTAGSLLSIKATRRSDGSWTGGLLDTLGTFEQRYGYFEARIKVPRGMGIWPAWWLARPPGSGGWPQELDVVEVCANEVGSHTGLDVTYPITTIHFADGTEANYGKHVADLSLAFHVYGLDWRADHVIWYLDGLEFWRYTGLNISSVAMPVILDLAIGGGWCGPPDATTPSPSVMQVDWVHVRG